MDKKIKIELTELFMAKAGIGTKGFNRCFHGTIKREKDENENPIVRGKIAMHDGYYFDKVEMEWMRNEKVNITGYIYAEEKNQWELGKNLDEIILMVLDKGIHNNKGVLIKRYGIEYNLN